MPAQQPPAPAPHLLETIARLRDGVAAEAYGALPAFLAILIRQVLERLADAIARLIAAAPSGTIEPPVPAARGATAVVERIALSPCFANPLGGVCAVPAQFDNPPAPSNRPAHTGAPRHGQARPETLPSPRNRPSAKHLSTA